MASGAKLDSFDHIGVVVKDCHATMAYVDIGGPGSVILEFLKTP